MAFDHEILLQKCPIGRSGQWLARRVLRHEIQGHPPSDGKCDFRKNQIGGARLFKNRKAADEFERRVKEFWDALVRGYVVAPLPISAEIRMDRGSLFDHLNLGHTLDLGFMRGTPNHLGGRPE